MKKHLITALTLIAIVVALTACGNKGESSPDKEVEDKKTSEYLEYIEFTPDSNIVRQGDYELSGLFTDILSEKSMSQGWYYYYSVGIENKVPWEEWKPKEGMYTSCELLFNYKNLDAKAKKSSTDRFSGVIVFNSPDELNFKEELKADYIEYLKKLAKENPDMEVYDLIPMQDNPGQFDLDGYQARSLDAKILDLNQEAKQSLVTDVSKKFYDSWANKSAEEMWAFFSYGDNVIYAVNLRKWMVEYE